MTGATVAGVAAACPSCREPLSTDLRCCRCGSSFERVDGIPVLLAAGDLNAGKREQVAHFDDEVDEEFEITRPHGQPRLYELLLTEKFRRAIRGVEDRLPEASVLCVCAGSGLDAEYLARRGARVVAADISLGAARRTGERARRYGVNVTAILADVERLPFADRAFDVVFVHDGLHHIERPEAGLGEMARVADKVVCVSEPAAAAVTRAAVRLGLAVDREDAGNDVARLRPADVSDMLKRSGFRVVNEERYGLFYRHRPGWAMRLFSRPGLAEISVAAVRVLNVVGGRAGNKLAVTAVRR